MEDDLKNIIKKMEEDLQKMGKNGRRPPQKLFLSHLGANLSWGWLSSLRLFC
jgi:hypothetical protein